MKDTLNVFKNQLQYGTRIKELGLTQKFVSDKVVVNQSDLSQYLKGTKSMPVRIRKKLETFLAKYKNL